jgi:peptide deformylase
LRRKLRDSCSVGDKNLASDMLTVKSIGGIVAGNQVGVAKRIFVITALAGREEDLNLINPELVESSGTG